MARVRESLSYLWILMPPVLTLVGYWFDSPQSALLFILGTSLAVVLIAEPLLGREPHHPIGLVRQTSRTSGKLGLGDPRVLILYSPLPLQIIAIGIGLSRVHERGPEWLLMAVPVGISGSISLLIAHEFMHMYSPVEVWLSRLAGAFQFWGVHELEHLYIHHKLEVSCTPEDTSYAKLGQSVYSYVALSVFNNYRNAWVTERDLLRKQGKAVYGPANRVVRTTAVSLVLTLLIGAAFGLAGAAFFLIQATVSMWQFLVTTYNQHYGLTRRKRPDGSYEPFTFMNTWSSDFYLTNRMTANLSRHAHHHLDPFCPYYNLKLIEHSPTLPGGYVVMSLVCMIPAVWYRLMNPRVAEVFRRRDQLAAQSQL